MIMKFLKFYNKFIFAINEHMVMGITINLGLKTIFLIKFLPNENDTSRVST